MVSLSIHHVIAALAVILPIAATRGNVYVHRAVTSEPLLQHEFGWFRDGDGKDKITDQYQVWETKDNGELKGKHTFKIEIQINGKIETPSCDIKGVLTAPDTHFYISHAAKYLKCGVQDGVWLECNGPASVC